jgi:hypothetical protein
MTDPIAAYSFDALVAGAVPDLSGHGHDFALPASCELVGGGVRHLSTAANSGGPDADVWGQAAHRTIVVDVLRTSNGFDGWITEFKNGDADTGVFGFLYSGANVQARAKDPSNSPTFATSAQPTVNVPYQLAMTYDGAMLRLFFDGVEKASAPFAGPIWTAATEFHLFDTVSTETRIDNLRLYDAALSAAEIAALVGVPVTDPAPPAATGRLKYESAPGVWTPVPLKTEAGELLAVKTETGPGTWEALP